MWFEGSNNVENDQIAGKEKRWSLERKEDKSPIHKAILTAKPIPTGLKQQYRVQHRSGRAIEHSKD